jgi:hypothetical protein
MPPYTLPVERPARLLRRVAKLQAPGYSDAWIARRLEVKTAQVKAARASAGFAALQDETELAFQEQIRGMRRQLSFKTLTALERLLAADDFILANLGIEKVIRLSTQGFMPDPAEDDTARAPAACCPRCMVPSSAIHRRDQRQQPAGGLGRACGAPSVMMHPCPLTPAPLIPSGRDRVHQG